MISLWWFYFEMRKFLWQKPHDIMTLFDFYAQNMQKTHKRKPKIIEPYVRAVKYKYSLFAFFLTFMAMPFLPLCLREGKTSHQLKRGVPWIFTFKWKKIHKKFYVYGKYCWLFSVILFQLFQFFSDSWTVGCFWNNIMFKFNLLTATKITFETQSHLWKPSKKCMFV